MKNRDCLVSQTCEHPQNVWAVIPARGGSIGIPRKNLISCAGKPLIQYVVEVAKDVTCSVRVVVITDSLEIAEFARLLSVHVILEETSSGPYETLDQKMHRNVDALRNLGMRDSDFLFTLQPTSPLTTANSIRLAIAHLESGFKSVISVANDPHLRWEIEPVSGRPVPRFEKRKNRQELPSDFRETGGILGVRFRDLVSTGTRVVEPVGVVEVDEREAIDIDSFGHLYEAEHWLTRGKILFCVEANEALGMGHLYRCLAVAHELSRHEILFVSSHSSPLVKQVIAETPFMHKLCSDGQGMADLSRQFGPDLIFLDVLDTNVETVSRLRESASSAKIVTFENDGEGARLCDVGVYDLTPPSANAPPVVVFGPQNAILGPSFELFRTLADNKERTEPLLLSFGGTDPARLTQKVLTSLEEIQFTGQVSVVLGLGAEEPTFRPTSFKIEIHHNVQNMALLMSRHRMAISSMGRTVFELAAMGVPTLTFAQNKKEEKHIHIGEATGSLLGGPGYEISVQEMASSIKRFIRDKPGFVSRLSETEGYRSKRSNSKVVKQILESVGLSYLSSK